MFDPLTFAIGLAQETGDLLLTYFAPDGLPANLKSDRTAVTAADIEADRLITHNIQHRFPLDEIISEESAYQVENDHNPIWVIDPLDGTTNFSMGLSIWGVSIARLVNGFPELGVIYFPMLHEMYTCQRGQGAFLNQQRISVKSPDPLQPFAFFACCSRSYRRFDITVPYKPRILGSGAYTFCMLARGSAVLGFDAASKIWDIAAAWLLVEEAGGVISSFDDRAPFPIKSSVDYRKQSLTILGASTSEVFALGQSHIHHKPQAVPFTPEDE